MLRTQTAVLVNFKDGSTIAQMSLPDMSTAIGFALNYPNRSYINVERMDLSNIGNLIQDLTISFILDFKLFFLK